MGLRLQFGGLRRRSAKPPTARQIARSGRGGRVFLFVFGLFFAGIGGAATWFFAKDVWTKAIDSRGWEEVACVVVASEVITQHDSDGDTYRPEITFRYSREGREFQSDRYRFMNVSSSDHGWARRVVATYSEGSSHTAFVNPENPSEAVLERALGWSILLTFIPAVFVLVGVGIMTAGVLTRGKNARAGTVRSGDSAAGRELRDAALLGLPEFPPDPAPGTTARLRPRHSPLARFLAMLAFALFWNAVVGTILFLFLRDGREQGSYETAPLLFLSLFAVIGLGLIAAALYFAVSFLFGPRLDVEANSPNLYPGRPATISWRFRSGAGGVQHLRISLEGVTEAEYTSGSGKNKSRVTDKKCFLRQRLHENDNRLEIAQGTVEFGVPDTLPHSFDAANNRIKYAVRFEGDIAFLPDLDEAFPVHVPPRALP